MDVAPDAYYLTLGRIVAHASRLELSVLELCLAIDLRSAASALIDHWPNYAKPGMVRRYARELVSTVADPQLRTMAEDFLAQVDALLLERHAVTHGIVASSVGAEFNQDGTLVKSPIWLVFDGKAKSIRYMSVDEMAALSDSLLKARTEAERLRDLFAPPRDRAALQAFAREYLRRREAGESTNDLEAQLSQGTAPSRATPAHAWHFRHAPD